ncbi:hypothetical protein VTL71DRAFT_14167 [Oculimacula yallundae]|uniref:DUF6590 domain-containing protein n=1 Tax=Oculimacula yallundae TaxID=86028 RepID=A0ABR4CJU4_9HELO
MGATKNGVRAEHHTIIYSEKKPVYIKGEKEKGMTKKPIKIRCSPRHKLDESSRLDYAKTYTVEYNVKVDFIGKVEKESEGYLTAEFKSTHPVIPSPLKDADGVAQSRLATTSQIIAGNRNRRSQFHGVSSSIAPEYGSDKPSGPSDRTSVEQASAIPRTDQAWDTESISEENLYEDSTEESEGDSDGTLDKYIEADVLERDLASRNASPYKKRYKKTCTEFQIEKGVIVAPCSIYEEGILGVPNPMASSDEGALDFNLGIKSAHHHEWLLIEMNSVRKVESR